MDVPGYAIITGAGSGIGRACAQTFARDGAAGVALLDLDAAGLAETKRLIDGQNHTSSSGIPCRIISFVLNVTDEVKVSETVNLVAAEFGRIDYSVHAAGVAYKHQGGAAYAETTEWQRVIDINLNGTFYMLKAVAKIMLAQEPIVSTINGRPLQRGSIVNFASIQGFIATPLSTSYVTSKHAVIGLTKTASEDYADKGLRINAVCPGYVESPMTMDTPEIKKVLEEKVAVAVPMKRAGRPEEIANGVVFLAGGRSSFATGSTLVLDGGFIQR